MGAVREFYDLVSKLNFYSVVYSYQRGLYFRCGKIRPRKKHLEPTERRSAWQKEKDQIEKTGGYLKFVLPFRSPELPPEFKRSFWTGLPLHESRFSVVLEPGLYFHIPVLDFVPIRSIQQRNENYGTVNVLSAEGTPMCISCNLRFMVEDLLLAYTAVHDYDDSLQSQTLSVLAKHSRGKPMDTWKDPEKVAEIENRVEEELREVATNDWGIRIIKLFISDSVPGSTNRLVVDGQKINLAHAVQTPSAEQSDD